MHCFRLLLWIVCLGCLSLAAVSAGDASSPWGGSIGVAYWYPDWSNDSIHFDSKTSGLFGPAGFIHYGRLGLGVQYFTGDFDLDFPGAENTVTADRTDLDLMLSYRITRIFQFSVLYKSIEYDWTQTYSVDSKLSGFGFGGGFNNIFSNNILLYGYGFYMPDLDFEEDIGDFSSYSGDADGYWIEAGIGYLIRDLNLVAKISYRLQSIDVDIESTDWTEETDGIKVDVSYLF